jgi:hypothetical protein
LGTESLPLEARRALDTLRTEKLLPAQRLPAATQGPLIDLWGRALLMGTRAPQFAREIGAVRDAALKRDLDARHAAISTLYQKAGRSAPSTEAMKTIDGQIDNALGSEPEETVRRTIKASDRTIEVSYAPRAGMGSVEVMQPGADGQPVRTVFRGEEKTQPTTDGKDLEAVIEPAGVCVMTEQTSGAARGRLNGAWQGSNGNNWTIGGQGGTVTVDEARLTGQALRYTGTYQLGKIVAFHPFEQVEDMGDDLPGDVRSQLVAWSPKLGFTIRLDVCSSGTGLRGTWSSQHVTYSGMAHIISKVHDPYDVGLRLKRDDLKVARGGRFPEDGP